LYVQNSSSQLVENLVHLRSVSWSGSPSAILPEVL
jgi:hypothetical protein